MAIENSDLFVLQKNDGAIRKASVFALLNDVVHPNYLDKPGREGEFIIVESDDGTITYSSTIDGGEYAV